MSDDATSVPWRSPFLHVALASSLMGVMGVSLISPALPAVKQALALTDAQASLLLTAYALPGIFLAPVMGILADRYGRRAALVPSLVVYGISGGAIVFVHDFTSILVLRGIQGATGSTLVSLAVTLLGDRYTGQRRNQLIGLNGTVLSVGTAAYPLLGGALATVHWAAPFALYWVGVPVGLLALYVLEESGTGGESSSLDYFRDVVEAVPTREAALLYGAYVGMFIVLYGALLTALPFLLGETYGLSSFSVGLVLTTSSVMTAVTSSQNGRLAQLFTNWQLTGLGFVAYGVGLTGIWLAASPVQIAGAILFFGGGQGLLLPSLDSETSGLTGERFRGGVMSLRTVAIRIGQTIGPPLFTAAAAFVGYHPLLLVTGVVSVAAGGAAYVSASRE
ncbi:MFS transporter [Halospeciosus flavus]|uniref:MFS transporter n=1 Tax=Halospeciosus flavus TaxID=3032283 RepID=A0ABD5Z0C9_9EURY|nr:MFS transporter [Halospeciosus flavus]